MKPIPLEKKTAEKSVPTFHQNQYSTRKNYRGRQHFPETNSARKTTSEVASIPRKLILEQTTAESAEISSKPSDF